MSEEWQRYGTAGDYVVWKRDCIFNITKGDRPSTDGGYYNVRSMLALKGLDSESLVLDMAFADQSPEGPGSGLRP